MNNKRIISLILAGVLCCTALTACTKKAQPAATTTEIKVVTDADDGKKMDIESGDKSTVEINDNNGNTLTIIPIYDLDGSTVFAGYIEEVKDKSGKALDQAAYPNLKKVIALTADAQKNFTITYDEKKNPVIIEAYSNEKGEIIAIADTLDLDKNKITDEYLKVLTTIDDKGNSFIRLDKDDKGKHIKVKVQVGADGKVTVILDDGTKEAAKATDKSKNIKDVSNDKDTNETNVKPSASNKTNNGASGNGSKPSNNGTPNNSNEKKPVVYKDLYNIVLGSHHDYQTDIEADNIDGHTNASGAYELKITVPDADKYFKYVITSKSPSSQFTGKVEFQLHTNQEIEVKFSGVNIAATAKTAIKFTNLDRVVEKENDSEGSSTQESVDHGTAVDVPAPKVELSFPEGTKSEITATGSGNNGAIYSECKLGIKGYGTADIDGGYNLSGICCTESIAIKNATLNITSKAKQGISCDKRLEIGAGATINISSKGDGIHCNKFETSVLKSGETDSKIKIRSIATVDCADGIDSNDQIIINSGDFDVYASSTDKFALKVRKVIKKNPKGIFEINGGKVVAIAAGIPKDESGESEKICMPTAAAKPVLYVKSPKATTVTVGSFTTKNSGCRMILSPISKSEAKATSNATGRTRNISWNDNIGMVAL